jgi:hypothetical protein
MIATRTTHSIAKGLLLLISMTIVTTLPVIAFGADESVPLPFSVELHPGQKAVIDFQFTEPPITPEGPADFIWISSGAGARGAFGSRVNLFVGGHLISCYTSAETTLGVFTAPSSVYTLRGPNPTDLSAIFLKGLKAVVEVEPFFDTG